MAVLTGARAQLHLTATAGRVFGDFSHDQGGVTREYLGPHAQLGLCGTAYERHGSFAGRSQFFQTEFYVSDRYVPVVTFSPISDIDIDVADWYVPVLGMSASVGQGRTVADSYVARLTFAVSNLLKTGEFPKSVADTYIPRLTLSAALASEQLVSDSYVPVLTLAATSELQDGLDVADSYIPVLTFEAALETQDSTVNAAVSDSYVPVLGFAVSELQAVEATVQWSLTDRYVVWLRMSATQTASGDVDRIEFSAAPFGVITLVER